ncbi:MAG TPA: hypothetical protein VGI03_01520 [Verrucomicrobiae bacterium]|jgi:hypothetical protein
MKKLGMDGNQRIVQSLFLAAVLGALATGCTTYQQQNKVILYWHQGNLTNAIVEATQKADANSSDKDAIIWRLEQGAVLRANGQYEDSNKAFDMAQDQIDRYSQKAKVSISSETGALLSNQAELPYEGRAYDGIMLNTYEALNYLALGEIDKARPELIRAYQRQQDAVEENRKRIAKVQAEAANQTNSVAIQKAQSDSTFQAEMQGTNYANLNTLKPYADYVNPFTVYLDGLYFMANAADSSDLERAHKSLERVAEFDPENDYVRQDLAAAGDLMNGKQLQPTTYVIFETGCAPERGQIRIAIPIIVSKVSYIGAAFPTLQMQYNYSPGLTVTAGDVPIVIDNSMATTSVFDTNAPVPSNPADSSDTNATATDTNTAIVVTTVAVAVDTNATAVSTTTTTTTIITNLTLTTSQIASMDSVIGLDFKNEMPVIITKTIASTVIKAVAAYAANNAAQQQNNFAGLFMQLGTAIYQDAVNIADTRTWTTLPKEFQVCRIPTPLDRKIVLETPGGLQRIPVTIQGGTINIIYVKSITATSPLLVTQIKLK